MWPWEHLALAYLFGSVTVRLSSARPTAATVAVVALASQLPDLIDKPLAWSLGVLPSGRTVGHSVFGAILLSALAVAIARRDDRRLGLVFVVAYGSHLLGDIVYALLTIGRIEAGFLLWPIVPATPDAGMGLVDRFGDLLSAFGRFLATPAGQRYLLLELALLAVATTVWYRDGTPGWRWLVDRVRGRI